MKINEEQIANPTSAVTLIDVAKRAGVNKVTASIVLSGGQGNTRVSDATRERILQSAKELHYQPNALARSLRSRQTHTIGFYMSGLLDTRDLFLSEIVSGLQQGCEHNQRDFLMHGTFRNRSTDAVYTSLLNGKIDGLVLHVESDDPLLPRLAASHLAVVAVANPVPSLPSITIDDTAGSRLLAEYLVRQGHQRALYLASPFPLTSAIRRHRAFLGAAEELGLSVASVTADPSSNIDRDFLGVPIEQRPTVAVCWNDTYAYLIIQQAQTRGIRIPADLAVTGFDGSVSLIPPAYHLTTIRAPWREVAETAVNLLCHSQGKPKLEDTVLPVEFIQGETA